MRRIFLTVLALAAIFVASANAKSNNCYVAGVDGNEVGYQAFPNSVPACRLIKDMIEAEATQINHYYNQQRSVKWFYGVIDAPKAISGRWWIVLLYRETCGTVNCVVDSDVTFEGPHGAQFIFFLT
jgi:hypothetical protein